MDGRPIHPLSGMRRPGIELEVVADTTGNSHSRSVRFLHRQLRNPYQHAPKTTVSPQRPPSGVSGRRATHWRTAANGPRMRDTARTMALGLTPAASTRPRASTAPSRSARTTTHSWFIRNAKVIRRENMLAIIKAEGLSGAYRPRIALASP